jgi:cation diffusion facilitator CzcD-associated flavoprotein CzcO
MRVAIIGAGASGIAMAVKLKRAGFHDFTVFEMSDSVGGTWFDNTFPGCEVDVQSHAYSFSFMPYDWSRNFARGEEVLQYFLHTVRETGIGTHLRLSSEIRSVNWDNATSTYTLTLASGETHVSDVVVSCVGTLSNPNYPVWDGLDDFQGPHFHTARWEHEHDLSDKRVAVVGTGSTACQVVPALAPNVKQVYLFQRSPTWVLPKDARDFEPAERARFASSRLRQRIDRVKIFHAADKRKVRRGMFVAESKEQQGFRRMLEGFIAAQIEDPDLRKLMTPDYPVGCKRPVQAGNFYASLNRSNVTVVPHAVSRVTRDALVDDTGAEHEVDVIVMATGFTAQQYLATYEITGRNGKSIHDVWNQSPRAFLGMTVPGFPNFFMLYGPNANGGVSAISQAEFAADAVVRCLKRMARRGARIADTRTSAAEWFVRWVDKGNANRTTRLETNCSNYFYAPDGRNVTQWPDTRFKYWLMTTFLPRLAIRTEPGPSPRSPMDAVTAAAASSAKP